MIVFMLKRMVVNGMEFPSGALCEMPQDAYEFTQSCNNWREFYREDTLPDDESIQVYDAAHFEKQREFETRRIEQIEEQRIENYRKIALEREKEEADKRRQKQIKFVEEQKIKARERIKELEAIDQRRAEALEQQKQRAIAAEDCLLSEARAEIKRLNSVIDRKDKELAGQTSAIELLKKRISDMKWKDTDQIIEDQRKEIRRLKKRITFYVGSISSLQEDGVDQSVLERSVDHATPRARGYVCMGHGAYRAMPMRYQEV